MLERDDGHCDTTWTREQLASLFDPHVGRARAEHLRSRVLVRPSLASSPAVTPASTRAGLEAVTRGHAPTIAILAEGPQGYVVRACCSSLETLAQARARRAGAVVPDPIC